MKVQTFPKSIWNVTSNGDGARNRRKPLPAPSWEALLSVRAAFWSIFGSNLGPRLSSLGRLSADFRDFLANFGVTCDFSLLEGAREGSGDRFRVSGEASRQGFLRGFWMVLCVALVVRGLLFLFQFRPKFGPIPDQLLFYRLCLTPVALPFSCRGDGRAERVK